MEELERNKRIKKEFKRIFNYFEKLDESEKSIIHPLIQNAAFMRVTLEDLQQIIAEQGPVEAYQNGANQHGVKQSAALQSYNALVKNYAAVLKNLFTWLPPADRPKKDPIEMLRSECEEDIEEQKEEKAKKIEEEIALATEYQRKQKEYDALIAKAETQEERNRLIEERKALRWK